ncbi:hypothetical protein ACFY96_28680 [Streptomyces massasporeus]
MLTLLDEELMRRLYETADLRLIRHTTNVVAAIGDLSVAAGVSSTHLVQRFKELTGVTAKRLARTYRFAATVFGRAGSGPTVVTGSSRGEVRVWQLAGGLRVGRAGRICEGPVQAVTVSQPAPGEAPLVATAGEGSRLRLWADAADPRSGRYGPPPTDRELLEINLEYDINCLLAADLRLLVGTKDGLAALAVSQERLMVDSERGPTAHALWMRNR